MRPGGGKRVSSTLKHAERYGCTRETSCFATAAPEPAAQANPLSPINLWIRHGRCSVAPQKDWEIFGLPALAMTRRWPSREGGLRRKGVRQCRDAMEQARGGKGRAQDGAGAAAAGRPTNRDRRKIPSGTAVPGGVARPGPADAAAASAGVAGAVVEASEGAAGRRRIPAGDDR
jgi:hypothetical protein